MHDLHKICIGKIVYIDEQLEIAQQDVIVFPSHLQCCGSVCLGSCECIHKDFCHCHVKIYKSVMFSKVWK